MKLKRRTLLQIMGTLPLLGPALSEARHGRGSPVAASSSSSLASLVATATAGQWSRWTGGDLSGSICNPAGQDPVVSNGYCATWDSINKLFTYYGHGHTGYQSLTLTYTDSNNTWTNDAVNVPVPSGIAYPLHQFTGQTGIPTAGIVCFAAYGNQFNAVRYAGSASWSQAGSGSSGSHGQSPGAGINPNVGSKGTLYVGSFYGIDVLDINSLTFNSSISTSGYNIGSGSSSGRNGAFFDAASNAVYMCGGDTGNYNLKISSAGALTQKGNLPCRVTCPIQSETDAIALDSYTSSYPSTSGTARKPFIVQPGGNCWNYTSSTDTWTVVFSGSSPNSTQANNAIFAAYCPTYDCVCLWVQTDGSGGCSAYVYPRNDT